MTIGLEEEHSTGLVDELTEEEKALFEGGGVEPDTPTEQNHSTASEDEGGNDADEAAQAEAEAAAAAAEAEAKAADEEKAGEAEGGEGGEDAEEDESFEAEMNGNKGRFIRHGAFHKERKMRQAAEKTLAERDTAYNELSQKFARADERIAVLMQAMQGQQQEQQQAQQQQAQQEQQKAIPNPEEDPFGYMRHLETEIARLNSAQQDVQTQTQEQQQANYVKDAFRRDAQAFSQETPDFLDAYQHLLKARDAELQALGKVNPQERATIMAREELSIVQQCFAQQRSPAQVMYELARGRGYVFNDQQQADEAAAAEVAAAEKAAAEQAAAGASQQEQQKPSAVARIEAIKKGQGASKSLGTASGGNSAPLTAEALADMPEAEFAKVVGKMSRAERAMYFGG